MTSELTFSTFHRPHEFADEMTRGVIGPDFRQEIKDAAIPVNDKTTPKQLAEFGQACVDYLWPAVRDQAGLNILRANVQSRADALVRDGHFSDMAYLQQIMHVVRTRVDKRFETFNRGDLSLNFSSFSDDKSGRDFLRLKQVYFGSTRFLQPDLILAKSGSTIEATFGERVEAGKANLKSFAQRYGRYLTGDNDALVQPPALGDLAKSLHYFGMSEEQIKGAMRYVENVIGQKMSEPVEQRKFG